MFCGAAPLILKQSDSYKLWIEVKKKGNIQYDKIQTFTIQFPRTQNKQNNCVEKIAYDQY